MFKVIVSAVSLFLFCEMAACAQPSCKPTLLSHEEAEKLVLLVPEALPAKKLGGKLSTEDEGKDATEFYYFMLTSTVSSPTTPMGNGMLGHFSVSKRTGRVLNIADEDVVSKEMEELQRKLRAKHCISSEMITKEQDVGP